MKNLDRLMEITKILADKRTQWEGINKAEDPVSYSNLEKDIIELIAEMKDISKINIADSQIAIDEKNKEIKEIEKHLDFFNLESDQYRQLAKMQDMIASFEKEADEIIDQANNLGKSPDENIDSEK
ncbi:hypothetical protein [Flavobacterium johnsoniae]|uniref:hypothetical protein n=1 Tax=Flavobacterium johnsoniae TaxID=986 RepID=UPI003D99E4C0